MIFRTDASLKYHSGNECKLTGEYCYIPESQNRRYVDCRNCTIPIIMAIKELKE